MTRTPMRDVENVRPTWVPAGRNKKAWEPIAVYEQDYPRKAPRPVASGISFRARDHHKPNVDTDMGMGMDMAHRMNTMDGHRDARQ